MSNGVRVATWVPLVLAVVGAGLAVITLVRGRAPIRWLTRRTTPQRWARRMIAAATFILIETVPRVSGASDQVVLGCSEVAFVFFFLLIAVMAFDRPPSD